ncbi:unnamed protein product [Paramecium pentaurelia]|uniref:Uncharacterized protein n=1 Tax=Paramecium pentaurelia TaxID=43138 RepID=A0A8S1WGR7_9CILI|nr:unnamed protein product [Paramecium pentaurelia]
MSNIYSKLQKLSKLIFQQLSKSKKLQKIYNFDNLIRHEKGGSQDILDTDDLLQKLNDLVNLCMKLITFDSKYLQTYLQIKEIQIQIYFCSLQNVQKQHSKCKIKI